MKRGLFITFEGIDGSGKSTQIERLRQFLCEEGYQVLLTREPGGTPISEKIRELLLDPENAQMTPVTEVMLYAASRAQLTQELIRPAIRDGIIVICDRFLDSSLAYQGYGRDLGEAVSEINSYGVGDCLPDLTIYLRVDPQTGRARIGDRAKDRIESEPDSFHQKVFQGYEKLREDCPGRIFTVDAAGPVDKIARIIRDEAVRRINEISSGD